METEIRDRIDAILAAHPVVLFMKGDRQQPLCGFSAATSAVLNDLLDDYFTVDVLADPEIRQGIKEYGDWPTIPQLYVKGELVGGADIVKQMYASGELQQLFGLPEPDRSVPEISITDAAAEHIVPHLPAPEEGVLHLKIDRELRAGFALEVAGEHDIVAESNGVAVHLDPGSAQRAHGVVIDWVKSEAGEGLALNFPGSVKSMSVQTLQQRLNRGDITLIDVRPAAQRALAAINGAVILEDVGAKELTTTLPKDAAIAFICHVGNSSRKAAQGFAALGFTDIWNVEGGIEAWATDIDPSVPRY